MLCLQSIKKCPCLVLLLLASSFVCTIIFWHWVVDCPYFPDVTLMSWDPCLEQFCDSHQLQGRGVLHCRCTSHWLLIRCVVPAMHFAQQYPSPACSVLTPTARVSHASWLVGEASEELHLAYVWLSCTCNWWKGCCSRANCLGHQCHLSKYM